MAQGNLELCKVIDTLTSSAPVHVKNECMAKLKLFCRSSDRMLKEACALLKERLEEDDADVRLDTLAVIHELFTRSHLFRTLILEDFQRILALLVGTNIDLPLPGTLAASKKLQDKSWETIEKWNEKFGASYKILSLAVEYLKSRKQKMQQPEQQPAWSRRLLAEISERTPDMQLSVTQMENCFRLLVPSETEEEAGKESAPATCPLPGTSLAERLRDHAVPLTFNLEIELSRKVNVRKTADNEEVLDTLRRLDKELMEAFFPMVKKWLKGLAKINHPIEVLRNTIDLKHRIEIVHEKFEELNVGSEDSSDSELEEVPEKEGYEPVVPAGRRAEYGLRPIEKRPKVNMPDKASRCKKPEEVSDPTSREAQLLRLNRVLGSESSSDDGKPTSKIVPSTKDLEEAGPSTSNSAPVRNIDLDLIYWEQDKIEKEAGSGFSDLNCVWKGTSKDDDNVKAQALPFRERHIEFSGTFEPVKWACRAPLPSGKLCPRRDRLKCPLHGPIVARDELGNPRDPNLAQQTPSVPEWQDPQLLRDLEAATGVQLHVGRPVRQQHSRRRPVTSARQRLEKKVFNKRAAKRVAESMDAIDSKKFSDKFGHQWNYALGT
ncbi:UV-stimulated scaffold protein A-like isoform X2 [Dermacentor albipictus]|uniref:UV-stimulated scaffold protein A-like isoform X2 n=1 Tax=Dermacentor albipictus TaxID=60249 RepID=UPI0031FC3287